ncbi:hypothetical protein [Lactiplantibacillus herbarum]|uniref:hypothetical protein n=1 Tax=Lactiplantibacillus herbarum TaxID=1670446 RepID=UPI00064E2481|nr:hypothetical protein [Lactiplantibacillus herbarum]
MAWGTFDISAFEALSKRIDSEVKSHQMEMMLNNNLKKSGMTLLEELKNRTPDSSSWEIDGTTNNQSMIILTVTNNVDDAAKIENGYRTHGSWISGQHTLTKAIAEIDNRLPAILDANLNSCLQGLM